MTAAIWGAAMPARPSLKHPNEHSLGDTRWTVAAAALALLIGGLLAVVPARAVAATFTLQPTPSPAGATSTYLTDLSCSSAKACTAVGRYESSAGTYSPYALRWNGSQWSVQSVPSPAGALDTDLDGVGCASAMSCVASGVAVYSSSDPHTSNTSTLIERWDGTSWTIEPGANPFGTGFTQELRSVSCSARAACTAVGIDNSPSATGTIAERSSGKKWTLQAPPAGERNGDQLTGVACATASSCVAVGAQGGSPFGPLAEQWDGTSWTEDQVSLPQTSGGSFPSTGELVRVSCTAASSCTAVGTWNPNGNYEQPLVESLTGSTWTAQNAAEISGPGGSQGGLEAVSCASSTACTAVGLQSQDGTTIQTLAERWDGSTWKIVKTPNLTSPSEELDGVACSGAAAKRCVVVGDYEDSAGAEQGMAGTGS